MISFKSLEKYRLIPCRWNNNIQKIAELNFSEMCKDKKYPDNWSLYLPIYKGIRDDKNTADDYTYIKSL
jgi:hypothetical protein